MDDNIKEHILDYTVGNADHWKSKFNCVLDDIELHNPDMLVAICFCDNNAIFNCYSSRRWKDIYIDIATLMDYIETFKFKDKLILDVLNLLFYLDHPLYDIIECEISLDHDERFKNDDGISSGISDDDDDDTDDDNKSNTDD